MGLERRSAGVRGWRHDHCLLTRQARQTITIGLRDKYLLLSH